MQLHKLWPLLEDDLVNEIFSQVQKSNKKLYNTALDVLAKPMKLRVVKVMEMPRLERHTRWAAFLRDPVLEPLSLNLLGEWLMSSQEDMLLAWTETLEMPHDGKGFVSEFPPCPVPEKLKAALDGMLDRFPAQAVLIYLAVFNKEARWAGLEEVLMADPRLTTGKLPEVS